MEKINIEQNKDNDLKFINGIRRNTNDEMFNLPITEDCNNNEKIEYFTE